MRKLGIVGSRNFRNLQLVRDWVNKLKDDTCVVSGGARGVDAVAYSAARDRGLATQVFVVPDWEWRKSRGAGMKRNVILVYSVDGLLAFWDGKSSGTANSIDLARRRGIWLKIIKY